MRNLLSLAFVVGLLLATVAAIPVGAQDLEDLSDQTIIFGAHPSQVGGVSKVEAAENLQASLDGPPLGAIRRYFRWEDAVAGDPLTDWAISQGSIPLISIVPIRRDGSRVPWSDIANAVEGEAIHTELMAHAAEVAALDGEVWFAFQHEPEIVANLPHGTNADFIAAYKRFVTEIKNAGATNVKFLWVLTSYAFELPIEDRRSGANWYPGDEWVDHLGADPYNWSTCRADVNIGWISFEELATPFLEFARQHPDKGVVIAEFGSVEDPNNPSRKADWITEIRLLMREPGWEQVIAMLTFNDRQPAPDTDCAWFYDTTPESAAAYSALANDELFGGTEGFAPIVGDPACVLEVVGDQVFISWVNTSGYQVLRRNGQYLASVPLISRFYVDPFPALGSTYVLRLWIDGQFTDLPCEELAVIEPEPEPIQRASYQDAITLDEVAIALDFEDADADLLRLYITFFNRQPDLDGAKYWISVRRQGYDLLEISGFMSAGQEFYDNYWDATDQDYVARIYTNVLDRPYDQPGYGYWLDFVRGTDQYGDNPELKVLSRYELAFYVGQSEEFKNANPFPG